MKVAAFLGSPRKNGNTAHLLKEFLKGVSQNSGTTIDEIYLQGKRISGCMGCKYCDRGSGCVQDDDMQKIYPIIKDADVLVFATPIYWWSMPSRLKAMIDRLFAFKGNELKGKKIYLLMTYGGALPNSGPDLVEKTFRDIFEYVECEVVRVYGVCTDEYMPVQQNIEALKEVYEIGRQVHI